jgi:hypothetical protein
MIRKKKKKGRKTQEQITYCVEISSFNIEYMFSISVSEKLHPGPYWEYAGIEINGVLQEPEKFKSREISGTILGSRSLVKAVEDPENCRSEPHGVGHINLRGKVSDFILSIPVDLIHLVYELLKDQRIRFLDMSGDPLYRGFSFIRSASFEMEREVDNPIGLTE